MYGKEDPPIHGYIVLVVWPILPASANGKRAPAFSQL